MRSSPTVFRFTVAAWITSFAKSYRARYPLVYRSATDRNLDPTTMMTRRACRKVRARIGPRAIRDCRGLGLFAAGAVAQLVRAADS